MEEITSQAPTTEEDIDPMVEITTEFPNYLVDYEVRYRSRFFVRVGHETTYPCFGNKHFFTIPCHRRTYQNYQQRQPKIGHIFRIL